MAEQRIALVTGANKGIGFETCRQLGRQGITVLMGARDPGRGNAAAARLKEEGLECLFVQLDVTDRASIRQAERYVARSFGRLDILVNNAGTAHPDEPLFENSAATVSMAALRETFDVNFFGAVEVTQTMLPLLRKSPAGRIVNVASVLGSLTLHSDPNAGLGEIKPFAYDASKTALNAFTVHLAAALQDTPIKVNSAHPGWVKTDLGGDQAPMEPSEGAKTSVALATLGANGPTGKFFHLGEELPW
jgi:NAD(P)-dependent dehydrogenase (short-subunit alcohol dehydrogenase family)